MQRALPTDRLLLESKKPGGHRRNKTRRAGSSRAASEALSALREMASPRPSPARKIFSQAFVWSRQLDFSVRGGIGNGTRRRPQTGAFKPKCHFDNDILSNGETARFAASAAAPITSEGTGLPVFSAKCLELYLAKCSEVPADTDTPQNESSPSL